MLLCGQEEVIKALAVTIARRSRGVHDMTSTFKEWNALTIKKLPDGTIEISVYDPWADKKIEVETLAQALKTIEQLDREHAFTGTIPIVV